MRKCPHCGFRLADDMRFCPQCKKYVKIPKSMIKPLSKKSVYAGIIVGVVLIVAAIGIIDTLGVFCKHDWAQATCTEPEKCNKCIQTQGAPIGHNWQPATCTTAETCLNCNMTQGSSSGHYWLPATCTTPKTCADCGEISGPEPSHTWKKATCTEPEICTVCNETKGTALGHNWQPATCTTTEVCSVCKKTQGAKLGHSMSPVAYDTPAECMVCGYLEPLSRPESGQVFIGNGLYCPSNLTIKNDAGDCYVKLKNSKKEDVFAFFVRSNATASVPVPAGEYYVYFAYGSKWYGSKNDFGDTARYSKDDDLLDFTSYTYEYTLYPVTNGNFTETPTTKEDFQ